MRRPASLAFVLAAACGAATPIVEAPAEEARDEPPPRYAVTLRFEEADETADGNPRTRVSLVRITPEGERTVAHLSTELGACYLEGPAGALIRGRCWWGGAGARFEVRREGESVIALRAAIDEERGEGELGEVARLEIPEDAELHVLGGDTARAP